VDKLCDATINPPERVNADHLAGKKTPSKIKEWTKKWLSKKRMEWLKKDKMTTRGGKKIRSETQQWMRKNLADLEGKMIPRPKVQNQMPRRKGVLLAKTRTYRWTQCNWYLHNMVSRKRNSPNCTMCKKTDGEGIEDTTEHMINDCLIHEERRSKMLYDLKHIGKAAQLLTSDNVKVVNMLADFLVEAEDARIEIAKEEEEEEKKKQQPGGSKVVEEQPPTAQPSNNLTVIEDEANSDYPSLTLPVETRPSRAATRPRANQGEEDREGCHGMHNGGNACVHSPDPPSLDRVTQAGTAKAGRKKKS
jgi:hypothetical protein